jgi:hypothetical protein
MNPDLRLRTILEEGLQYPKNLERYEKRIPTKAAERYFLEKALNSSNQGGFEETIRQKKIFYQELFKNVSILKPGTKVMNTFLVITDALA